MTATGVMKRTPNLVTPTAVASASTVSTPNPFAALAETPESETESVEESVVESSVDTPTDIPEDEFLPNQLATEVTPEATPTAITATAASITNTPLLEDPINDSNDDLSLSSISTMGSSDTNNDAFSKAKISDLMDRIQQGSTSSKKAYTYADIADFQQIMGHALVTLPSDKSEFGYSFLVDTKEDHKARTNSNKLPAAMPSLPEEPDYTCKIVY